MRNENTNPGLTQAHTVVFSASKKPDTQCMIMLFSVIKITLGIYGYFHYL